MNLVKSDRRTLMKEDALSNCLTIKLEEPSKQEFDPAPTINLWFNLKPHRKTKLVVHKKPKQVKFS